MVEDGSGTAHRLAVAVLTVPPRTDGPPPHWHQKHDETFYVIAGTARFTVGDTHHEASAGTFVSVPIGAEHTFANPGDEPAIILNTFTPDLYAGYFRDGRAYAASVPNGRFEPIRQAGRLPHLEQPEQVLEAIHRFADQTVPAGTGKPG
jgi:quercetin dioxygenase-like cupin family protein